MCNRLNVRQRIMRTLLIVATVASFGLLSAIPATAQINPQGVTEQSVTDFSSKKRVRSYKPRRYGKRGWRQRYVRTVNRHRYRQGFHRQGIYEQGVRYRQRLRYRHAGSVSTSGIVAPLAAKARQIVAACGSRVVSGMRHGARMSSGHSSNHASGRAVDIQGNPSCIYAMLRGWPGGVSTDYASAPGGPHVHVSYSPRGSEWGLKFSHGVRRAYAYAGKTRGKARRWRRF